MMVKFNLTPAQKRAFNFIEGFIGRNGHSPSFSEIAAGCGLKSKSSVDKVVKALKGRGWIDYLPNQSRSITIL